VFVCVRENVYVYINLSMYIYIYIYILHCFTALKPQVQPLFVCERESERIYIYKVEEKQDR